MDPMGTNQKSTSIFTEEKTEQSHLKDPHGSYNKNPIPSNEVTGETWKDSLKISSA